jgi:hypothetical protein
MIRFLSDRYGGHESVLAANGCRCPGPV